MRSIPEDSVLRRHFCSAIELGQIPFGVPEDSVLRRHFLAALNRPEVTSKTAPVSIPKTAEKTPAKPKPARTQPDAVTRSRPTVEPKETKTVEEKNIHNKGLLAWFKRLFGS